MGGDSRGHYTRSGESVFCDLTRSACESPINHRNCRVSRVSRVSRSDGSRGHFACSSKSGVGDTSSVSRKLSSKCYISKVTSTIDSMNTGRHDDVCQ
jgi:hypothetical protein